MPAVNETDIRRAPVPEMPPIVSTDELDRYPHAVLADVRWYLDGRDARAIYERGHLPDAVFVDLETALSAHDRTSTEGRHPFPTPAVFAAAMSELGIGDSTTVIAYDDSGGATAGRLVVMLRMIGRRAAVLDGGIHAWAHGLEVGVGRRRGAARFTPHEWPVHRFADADTTAELARSTNTAVLDARSAERFSGDVVAIDPRAGHIPGAVSAPFSAVLDPDTKRFLPVAQLRDHFESLGVDTAGSNSGDASTITYCGSGVSACVNILAMEHAGLPAARLYVASMSGWSADPERPLELGGGR